MSKLSPKPSISSSPNRAEKFQPPPPLLTRFLRTNVANRSRGRSLSSPMFSSVGRKKKADIETQEPSSPKVTCIGQVRVRRSFKQAAAKPKPTKQARSCKWLKRFLFCGGFSRKPTKPRRYSPFWHRWFPSYHRRKASQSHVPDDSSRRDFKPRIEEEEDEEEEKAATSAAVASLATAATGATESGAFAPSTPPKNALLLMRCRSAPNRSGNLLGAVSLSLSPQATGPKQPDGDQENEEDDEEEKVAQLGVSSRPLILTRCKSEPASRTGSRIALVDRCDSHAFFV